MRKQLSGRRRPQVRAKESFQSVHSTAQLSDHVSPCCTSVSRASVVAGVVVSPVSSASLVCLDGVGGSRVVSGRVSRGGVEGGHSLRGLHSAQEVDESAAPGSTNSWSDTANLLTFL